MTSLEEMINDSESQPKTTVPSPQLVAPSTAPLTPAQQDFFSSNRKIGMVDDQGKVHLVPGTTVQAALTVGWKVASDKEEAQQAKVEGIKLSTANSPLGSAGSEVFNTATNTFLGGVPEVIGEHYNDQAEKQAKQELTEEHPIAHYTGKGLGFLGQLALTGGLAEAGGQAAKEAVVGSMKEGALKTILGQAAKDATIGAAYSAPEAVANAAVGDYDKAGESLLWGLGTGAVLGAGIGSAKAVGSIAKEGLSSVLAGGASETVSNAADKYGDKLWYKQLNLSAADQRKIGTKGLENIKEVLTNLGEVGTRQSPEDIVQRLENTWTDRMEPHRKELQSMYDAIKTNPEKTFDAFKTSDIVKNIKDTISERAQGLIDTPLLAPTKKAMDDILETIVAADDGSGTLSPDRMFKLKTTIGKVTKFGEAGHNDEANIAKLQALEIFDQHLKDGINSLYTQTPGGADKMASYLAGNKQWKAFSDLRRLGSQIGDEDKLTAPGLLQSILGHRVGGAVLGSLFGPIGTVAGYHALPLLEKMVDGKLTGMSIRALKKIASNPDTAPFFGNMAAKAAQDAVTKHIDAIPAALMSAAKVAPLAAINPLKSYLGDRSNGLSKTQQYQRVADDITNGHSNPGYITQEMGKLVNAFGDDPKLAHVFANKNFQAIDYLYNSLPKNPNPPVPFDDKKWEPTSQQKAAFLQKLAIVENPMVAIHKLSNGTIQAGEIEALKTIYPKIYGAMVDKIVNTGFEQGATMPYNKKITVSKFTGIPLDPSLKPDNMKRIQDMYSTQPKEDDSGKQPAPTSHHTGKEMKGPSLGTSTQRIANKGTSK